MIRVSRYLLEEEDRSLVADALSYGYVLDEPPRCIPSVWLSAQEDGAAWYEQLRLAVLYPSGRGKTTALGGLGIVSLGFDAQQLNRLARTLLCIKAAMRSLPEGAPEMAESRRRERERATISIDAALGGISVFGLWPEPLEQRSDAVNNQQARRLLDRGAISVEIAKAIDDECGEDDIGLFLGHLLATGRITAEVVQAHLAQGAPDGR